MGYKQFFLLLLLCLCATPLTAAIELVTPQPKSFLQRKSDVYKAYLAAMNALEEAHQQSLAERVNQLVKPLSTTGFEPAAAFKRHVETLVKEVANDTKLSPPPKNTVVSFLKLIEAAIGFVVGPLAKVAFAAVLLAGAVYGYMQYWPVIEPYTHRWRSRLSNGRGYKLDKPAYALSMTLTPGQIAAANHRESKPLIIRSKGGNPDRITSRAECMKDLFLQHAVKRNTQLRPFVTAPHWDGDLFESTAHAIAQIDCLSVGEFKRRRDEAEPYVRKRLELQYVVPNEPTVTEYPEELLRLTEDYYEEVERALRAHGSAADRVKKIGEGPARMNVDNVLVFRFSPRCNGTIILKVPNPYAYYKLQNIYRDFEDDYGGENHSVYRNVERVLIAADIRRDRSTKVTAPDKRLALRKGVTPGRLITDKTAIVMAEFITEGPGGLYDLSYPDINRIIDVGDKYGLADLHKWNVICGSGGQYYLIDTEVTQARRYGLKPEAQYVGLLNEYTFTGASKDVAEVLARRKKARGAR